MGDLPVTKRDRILGLFPHPDDESLGAGIFLQRALAAGAAVLPVFLTSGEGNAWPQRVLDRKLVLGDVDRKRFGLRRQQEAREALGTLGINPDTARFLNFPDTRLTSRLLADSQSLLEPLQSLITDWQPTVVLAPVLADCHPDHSVTAALALALRGLGNPAPFRLLAYATHVELAPGQEQLIISGTPEETARKRKAIATHRTQLVFRRRFHLGFARSPEVFFPVDALASKPTVHGHLSGNELHLNVRLPPSWRSFRAPVVTVVTLGLRLQAFSFRVSRAGAPPSPGPYPPPRWRGRGPARQLVVELPEAPPLALVKVSRPCFLYDEDGFVVVRKGDR